MFGDEYKSYAINYRKDLYLHRLESNTYGTIPFGQFGQFGPKFLFLRF